MNTQEQFLHISVRTLVERQLSEWQELTDTLQAEESHEQVSITYCELQTNRLLAESQRLAKP